MNNNGCEHLMIFDSMRTADANVPKQPAETNGALLCVSSVTGGGILIFRCWHLGASGDRSPLR